MYACFLNVFHDCADHRRLAVGDAIDIHLDRVFQEAIDKNGPFGADFDCTRHVPPQILFFVNEFHRAPTEHETGPHQYWVANLLCNRDCFLGAYC